MYTEYSTSAKRYPSSICESLFSIYSFEFIHNHNFIFYFVQTQPTPVVRFLNNLQEYLYLSTKFQDLSTSQQEIWKNPFNQNISFHVLISLLFILKCSSCISCQYYPYSYSYFYSYSYTYCYCYSNSYSYA